MDSEVRASKTRLHCLYCDTPENGRQCCVEDSCSSAVCGVTVCWVWLCSDCTKMLPLEKQETHPEAGRNIQKRRVLLSAAACLCVPMLVKCLGLKYFRHN